MIPDFQPQLGILAAPQRRLWDELGANVTGVPFREEDQQRA
jgi:hypothetical protein